MTSHRIPLRQKASMEASSTAVRQQYSPVQHVQNCPSCTPNRLVFQPSSSRGPAAPFATLPRMQHLVARMPHQLVCHTSLPRMPHQLVCHTARPVCETGSYAIPQTPYFRSVCHTGKHEGVFWAQNTGCNTAGKMETHACMCISLSNNCTCLCAHSMCKCMLIRILVCACALMSCVRWKERACILFQVCS